MDSRGNAQRFTHWRNRNPRRDDNFDNAARGRGRSVTRGGDTVPRGGDAVTWGDGVTLGDGVTQ
jgi:hypothetical protein